MAAFRRTLNETNFDENDAGDFDMNSFTMRMETAMNGTAHGASAMLGTTRNTKMFY